MAEIFDPLAYRIAAIALCGLTAVLIIILWPDPKEKERERKIDYLYKVRKNEEAQKKLRKRLEQGSEGFFAYLMETHQKEMEDVQSTDS